MNSAASSTQPEVHSLLDDFTPPDGLRKFSFYALADHFEVTPEEVFDVLTRAFVDDGSHVPV